MGSQGCPVHQISSAPRTVPGTSRCSIGACLDLTSLMSGIAWRPNLTDLQSHMVMVLFAAQGPLENLSPPIQFKGGCLPLLEGKAYDEDLANQSILYPHDPKWANERQPWGFGWGSLRKRHSVLKLQSPWNASLEWLGTLLSPRGRSGPLPQDGGNREAELGGGEKSLLGSMA